MPLLTGGAILSVRQGVLIVGLIDKALRHLRTLQADLTAAAHNIYLLDIKFVLSTVASSLMSAAWRALGGVWAFHFASSTDFTHLYAKYAGAKRLCLGQTLPS